MHGKIGETTRLDVIMEEKGGKKKKQKPNAGLWAIVAL